MDKKFLLCGVCNKKLIQRDGNGIFHFAFGKDAAGGDPPVEMMIYGSIKMKCIKKTCRAWNIFNFFPFKEDFK